MKKTYTQSTEQVCKDLGVGAGRLAAPIVEAVKRFQRRLAKK